MEKTWRLKLGIRIFKSSKVNCYKTHIGFLRSTKYHVAICRVKLFSVTNWKWESRKEIWWTAVIDSQPSGERKSEKAGVQ